MQTNKEEIQAIIDSELNAYTKKYGKEFRAAVLKIVALEKLVSAPAPEQMEKERKNREWEEYKRREREHKLSFPYKNDQQLNEQQQQQKDKKENLSWVN